MLPSTFRSRFSAVACGFGFFLLSFGLSPAQTSIDGSPIRLTEAEIEAMTVFPSEEWPVVAKGAVPESPAPPAESAAGAAPVSGFSVDVTDRNAVIALYHEVYMASQNYAAIHGWTGDVAARDAGTTSASFKEDVRRRVNYFRAMAGLPANITFDETKSAKAQKAALIMSHQGALSHYPATDFPDNPCLSADGEEAAANGNLALGSYGPGAIDQLMEDDGDNNAVVGHRRWLLYSRAQEMGTGDIPIESPASPYSSANCVWVIGNFAATPATPPQIAWPPAGYVPYHLAPASNIDYPRWSFSYPGANFSAATVTMSQGATNIPVVKESVGTGYGDNTLAWRPDGIPSDAPASDTTYTVNITGISGAPFTSRTYQVTLIDPNNLNAEISVSGPADPGASQPNTYQFTPIPSATGYEAKISSYSGTAWTEGAESSPAPRVIDGTDAAYDLLSTHTKSTGSRAFHLCTPSFDPTDFFTIDRDLVPQTGSQVQFKYRRLFMHPDSKLRVQLSRDGGQTFKTFATINGNNSAGSSSQWDSATFLSAAFPVPAEYQNRVVRLRFLMDPTDITYVGTDANNGIYIDAVTLTNSLNLTGSTTTALGPAATSFTYTPSAIGESRLLTVSPELGGRFWGGGEVFFTTATTPQATLSIGDVSVSEASGPAVFTINLSIAQGGAVTVNYATSDGSATAPSDYTSTSGTATIPAGQTTVTVPVPVVNDASFEAAETFLLTLSNPSPGVILSDGSATGTITNDDVPPQLSIADASAGEGAAGLPFLVTLSSAVLSDVTVSAAASDGTARSGLDFASISRTLTIPAGQTSATLAVPLREDALDEPDETFLVTLSAPVGAVIGDSEATGTILDDDSAARAPAVPGAAPAPPGSIPAAPEAVSAGRFGGLLVDSVDATLHRGAIPSFVLDAIGNFSAQILFGSERISLRGTLDPTGGFTGALLRKTGAPGSATLQLRRTTTGTPGFRVAGTIVIDGASATVDLVRAAFSKLNPTAKAGLYTILIPDAAGSLPTEPDGDGYATMAIASAGTVSANGALGDGQPFGFASFLSADGEFWVYATPYPRVGGIVSGRIAFENLDGVSDFHGPLRWSKQANTRASVYPGSFDVARTLIGSAYTPPPAGTRVLSSLANQHANARVTLVGGNLAGGSAMKTVSWNALNAIRHYGPETLTATVKGANGLVSGVYIDRSVPLSVRFGGVAFQKQQLVSGAFVGTAASGSVRIEPGVAFDIPSSSASLPVVETIAPGTLAATPPDAASLFNAVAAGQYSGLITESGGPGTRGAINGFVLKSTGAFSASILYFGERLTLKNSLSAAGMFTGMIDRPGRSPVAVNLQLYQTTGGAGYKIRGTLSADGVTVDIDLQRSSFSKTTSTPHAGIYTLLIPAVPGSPDTEPGGDGYATVTVSASGGIVARGRVGDHTVFSNAAVISLDGEWPLFSLVYPKSTPPGFLGGLVRFRNQVGSDFDGQMTWSREPNVRDQFYPAGFNLTRQLIGSRYQPPVSGARALAPLANGFHNARLSFIGGNLAATPFSRLLTWDARNAMTYFGPESFRGGLTLNSGLVSFVFRDPEHGLLLSAGGVVYQKQGQARGVFPGSDRMGRFVIEAR